MLETLVREEFGSKANLIDANFKALAMGREAAAERFEPIGLRMRRSDAVGDRIYVEGNTAAALGAVYGGATVCAWYPITPSTSLAEAFTAHCQKLRVDPATGEAKFAIIQGEDEIASIGIVVGAGWNGARAFTCTSGPGISLMNEFIGLSYFAEIPAVIFDVQRGGPSTGMPTRTQQSDILLAAYASHGDTKHPLLFPEDPAECFDFGALAFDLADRLQTTIFVMLDLDIGMNEWLCRPFTWDDARKLDHGKVMTYEELEAGKDFGRYLDVDGDGIPYRTLPSVHPDRGAYFTRGTSRDPYARYSEEGPVYVGNMERLLRKFETAKSLIPAPVARPAKRRTPHGVIYFGSTTPAMHEALETLDAQGVLVDGLRVRGFPFSDEVIEFIAAHETVFVVEQNRDAQLRTLVMVEGGVDPAKLVPVLGYDGSPITARFITDQISRRLQGQPVATPQAAESQPNDLHHQAASPSPAACSRTASASRGGTMRARSRPSAPAAGTTRSRRRSSRRPSSSTCRRIGWPSSPASAARRRPRTTSSAIRTASTPCTDGCPPCSPAPTWPTAS